MTVERAFQVVWRFNALVIAVACLVVLAYGAVFGAFLVRDFLATRVTAGIAPVARDGTATPPDSAKIDIRSFTRIEGQQMMWAPLATVDHIRSGYYSKDATNTRDYVFYDLADGTYRRLLDRDDVLIADAQMIRPDRHEGEDSSNANARARPPLALAIHMVTRDTNGDGRLSHQDARDIALARPDGRGLTTVATGIARVLGTTLTGSNTLVVMLKTANGAVRALHIALDDFSVIHQNAMPTAGERG